MWRLIKALGNLVVVTFGFWAAFTGDLSPALAYGGMIVVLLGAEGVENVLVGLGSDTKVVVRSEEDTRQAPENGHEQE